MDRYLRAFIETHPGGWNHDDWLALLSDLEVNGVDVRDRDEVGVALEKERLSWELRRRAVPGLGPKRIEAVVGRFGTFWSLRQAGPEDLAAIRTIPPALAERLVEAVR